VYFYILRIRGISFLFHKNEPAKAGS
jgi:hypothetical protein